MDLQEYEKTVGPLMDEATAAWVAKKEAAKSTEEMDKLQAEYENALNQIATKFWKVK